MKNALIIISVFCLFIFGLLEVEKNNATTDSKTKHIQEKINTSGITKIRSTISDNNKQLDILFIGNSYTFFYDIPGLILKIAEKDPSNSYKINIQSIAYGGYTLKQHWNNKATHQLIEGHKWDIIVLQEQSMWALFSDKIKETNHYVRLFSGKSVLNKSQAILYETWPRKPESHWYRTPTNKATRNPEYMYRSITKNTQRIAYTNNIVYAPVGEYWYYALNHHPEIELYAPDGTHQSLSGSFLAALVFYTMLTGNNPENSIYTPPSLPEEHSKILKQLASKNLLEAK